MLTCVLTKTFSTICISQITQTDKKRVIHSTHLNLLIITLPDGEVDPVGEHDGDHHQAREARHEGEHTGVQLGVIRLAVVIILARVPT